MATGISTEPRTRDLTLLPAGSGRARRHGGSVTGGGVPFSARGFTLIEILVVVLIIGVLVGLATLAIRDDPEQRLETEGQRFTALLRLASQEAVLQSREIAVEFVDDGYRFLTLEEGEWVELADQILRPRELPEDMDLDLVIEGERLDFGAERRRDPRVFLLSGGEMTPFELDIRYDDRSASYRIRGDIAGRLTHGD